MRLLVPLSTLVASFVLAGIGAGACPGIDRVDSLERSWSVHRFYRSGTHAPLVIAFTANRIPGDAKVDVHDGHTWSSLAPLETRDGIAVRIAGRAWVAYRANGCGDVIEPKDK